MDIIPDEKITFIRPRHNPARYLRDHVFNREGRRELTKLIINTVVDLFKFSPLCVDLEAQKKAIAGSFEGIEEAEISNIPLHLGSALQPAIKVNIGDVSANDLTQEIEAVIDFGKATKYARGLLPPTLCMNHEQTEFTKRLGDLIQGGDREVFRITNIWKCGANGEDMKVYTVVSYDGINRIVEGITKDDKPFEEALSKFIKQHQEKA